MDDDDNWINSLYVNNEDVATEKTLPDDIDYDDIVRMSNIQRDGINNVKHIVDETSIPFRVGDANIWE